MKSYEWKTLMIPLFTEEFLYGCADFLDLNSTSVFFDAIAHLMVRIFKFQMMHF